MRLIADVPARRVPLRRRSTRPSSPRWRGEAGGRSRRSRSASRTQRSTSCRTRARSRERSAPSTTSSSSSRRARVLPEARAALRRAVRRLLGDAELLPRGADAPARHRGAERRRRRRGFAGYDRYVANSSRARLDRLPRRCGVRPAPPEPLCRRAATPSSTVSRARRLTRGLTLAARRTLRADTCPASTAASERGCTRPSSARHVAGSDPGRLITDAGTPARATSPLDRMLDVDTTTYLPATCS